MDDLLAERFERSRSHLRAVAYRILGSRSDADDAVQEAWLRLNRSDAAAIENLNGWLTTVVARVCLDLLRSRRARHEESIEEEVSDEPTLDEAGPEREALLADSISSALVVVLEMLTPAERVAFVLHDLFDLSFEEIAPIVGRSPAATRQLASRGRRRVRGASRDVEQNRARQREVVEAFFAASRGGDFAQLVALLDPNIVLRADRQAVEAAAQNPGAPKLAPEIRGANEVAAALFGRANAAQLAWIDGAAGAAWAPGGRPIAAFRFTVAEGKVSAIEIVTETARLAALNIVVLPR